MNKEYGFKNEPLYDSKKLRLRISETIKSLRDKAEELSIPQSKQMPVIPVTGDLYAHKYFQNKSRKKF